MLRAELLRTRETGWTILILLLVNLVVFFPKGLQKLLFPEIFDASRIAKDWHSLCISHGAVCRRVENYCGLLIIIGLFTGLVTIPLLILMGVVAVSPRLPILTGNDTEPFHLAADIKHVGFWSAQQESRADLTVFLGLLLLLIVGALQWSLDASLSRRCGKTRLQWRSQ